MPNIAGFLYCLTFFGFVGPKNGFTSSIKPQQVTYIVPGIDNFDQADIADFAQKAQDNMVSSSVLQWGW